MKPAVSVVMPVHNGGVFLQAAVASILGQSLADFELIVVDDHSDDGAIESLGVHDRRVSVLPSAGRGVSAAFNTGMAHARGAFVARMDADDIALPDRLQHQLGYLEQHPGIDICGGCVEIFSDQGIAGGNLRYQDWLNGCLQPAQIQRELYIESPVPNPTAFFRRSALERLQGYGDPAWPEDYDLFLRADSLGMRMGKPAQVLLRWREHPGRLTRNDMRYSIESFQRAKAHYLAQYRLPAELDVVIWGAGPTGRLFHDLLREQGVGVKGFLEVHPRRIGGLKRGLPMWPVERLEQFTSTFVLVAVGAAGVRQEIRTFMEDRGWVEGEQFLFVA